MIKFNSNDLYIRTGIIKSVSAATLDPFIILETGQRYHVPFTVSNFLIKNCCGGTATPLVPIKVEMLMYGDRVISATCPDVLNQEKFPVDALHTMKQRLTRVCENGEWFWDGSLMFRAIKSRKLTTNVDLVTFTCYDVERSYKAVNDTVRSGLSVRVVGKNGEVVEHTTNPFLKLTGGSFGRVLQRYIKDDEIKREMYELSELDAFLIPTLKSTLYLGNKVTECEAFSYEDLDILQIPQLMVEYQTLSLQALPALVKQTGASSLSTSQLLMWMIGLQYRVTTPEDYYHMCDALSAVFNSKAGMFMFGDKYFIKDNGEESDNKPKMSFYELAHVFKDVDNIPLLPEMNVA